MHLDMTAGQGQTVAAMICASDLFTISYRAFAVWIAVVPVTIMGGGCIVRRSSVFALEVTL
jgi:hypothetical protein